MNGYLGSILIFVQNAPKPIICTSTPISRKDICTLAKVAVDFTGLKDGWYSEEMMKTHVEDEIILGIMNLNIYHEDISHVEQSNYNDDSDTNNECNHENIPYKNEIDKDELKEYLDRMAFKDIPESIKKANIWMKLQTLCQYISSMSQYELGMFFQCCYNITHNNHFAYILFKRILSQWFRNEYEFHLLLDGEDGKNKLIEWIAYFQVPWEYWNPVRILQIWVQAEDFERRHTNIHLFGCSIELSLSRCDENEINDVLTHLEHKLNGYPIIMSLMVNNVRFITSTSPITSIIHVMTRKTYRIIFSNCIFLDKMFVLTVFTPLKIDEQNFIKQLRCLKIIKCAIKELCSSLSLASGLKILNIQDYEFTKIPNIIYEMEWLILLKLVDGKLRSEWISTDIKRLKHLDTLILSRNHILHIPKPITEMETLKKLIITGNNIKKIPMCMKDMKNLELLILDKNPLGNKIDYISIQNIPNTIHRKKKAAKISLTRDENIQVPPMIKYLSIKNCGLQDIPCFVQKMTTLVELDVANNNIGTLKLGFATSLGRLKVLLLHNNRFSTFPKEIENMNVLEELCFSKNVLTRMSADQNFVPPLTLKKLNISHNPILEGIPQWVFTLVNLTDLNITNCNISFIPLNIGNLKELISLKVGNNQLSGLTTAIGNLKKLRYLNFSLNKKIRAFPICICKLTKLEILIGNECSIETKISSSFCDLVNLRILNLKSNRICWLPTNIGNLIKLKEFNLSDNKLNDLPASMKWMHWLKTLLIDSNRLSYIPEWIFQFRFLEILNISKNKVIMMIKEANINLPRLKVFHGSIAMNCDTSCSFYDLYNLVYLNLSNSIINELPEDIGGLRLLNATDFSACMLQKLPKSIYSLPCLKYLKANSNFITELSSEIVRLCKTLIVLKLSNNLLTALPDEITMFNSYTKIDVMFNLFSDEYKPKLDEMKQKIGNLYFTTVGSQVANFMNKEAPTVTHTNCAIITDQSNQTNDHAEISYVNCNAPYTHFQNDYYQNVEINPMFNQYQPLDISRIPYMQMQNYHFNPNFQGGRYRQW